jgi:hypothetical protein
LARRALLSCALIACAVVPASAHAGSYDVYSCAFGPNFYGNNAWKPAVAAAGGNPALFTTDSVCTGAGDVLVAGFQANVAYAPASSAQLQFIPPVNTVITDYTLSLHQRYSVAGQASDPNTAFVMTTFGPYAFTLAGQYDAGVIAYVDQDKHYWGAAGPIDKSVTISKADSPHSSVVQGTAPSLVLYAGCWGGRTANCTLGASDVVQTQLLGSKVTIRERAAGDVGRQGRYRPADPGRPRRRRASDVHRLGQQRHPSCRARRRHGRVESHRRRLRGLQHRSQHG